MSGRADWVLRALAWLTVLALAGVAGAISFAHMSELAVIRSSLPGVPVDLGFHVVDMSLTDGAVCRAGRLAVRGRRRPEPCR